MEGVQNIIYFAIFLGVLVTVHELGHFLVAKWAGVKVLKFSIGFGPKVLSVRRGETEYQIAALPLGGFVQMLGQHPGDEGEPGEEHRSFLKAPWWKRMLILSAGPGFNFLFPVLIYFFVFLGDHQATSARVGWVEPNLPAAMAGVQPGDVITRIDGKPIRTFEEIRAALDGVFERVVPITVQREGQEVVLQITPRKNVEVTEVEKVARGLLGISPYPRAAVVGVPAGSAAERAGLRTFDRVLSVDGAVVRDELQLLKALARGSGPYQLQVARGEPLDVGGAPLLKPSLVTLTVEREAAPGLGALGGAESGDLYAWQVFPDSPAAKAGLKVGDRLLAVNGTPLSSSVALQLQLKAAERTPFELRWRSGGELRSRTVSQAQEELLDELKNRSEVLELGVRTRGALQGDGLAAGPEAERITIHRGPVEALVTAARVVPEEIRKISLVLAKLFTRELALEKVGGPVMLFQVAAKSAEAGYETFLNSMALVSINLGLVNLLPIPILDGFGLLAAAWEGIRRRPIPEGAREVAYKIGFAMLAVLMVLVFKNDLTKVFFR